MTHSEKPASPYPPPSAGVDAVAVNALKWVVDVAHSITGRYWLQQSDNLILLWRDQHRIKKFGNIELAKAAAQGDYEQRIRSALTPAPTPVEAGGEAVADLERTIADLRQQIMRLTGKPAVTDDEIRASTQRAIQAGEAQSSPEYWRSIYPDGNYPEGV